MKRVLAFSAFFLFSLLFSQTSDTVLVNYKGGNSKLISDLEMNFGQVFKEYNFNGTVRLSFTLLKNGKIEDLLVSPESEDKVFSYELKRALLRTRKNWIPATINGAAVKSRIVLPLTYYVTLKETDGRLRFFNNEPYRSARLFQ